MGLDGYGEFKPQGDPRWLKEATPAFARTCPFSPAAADEDRIAAEHLPDAPQQDGMIGRFEQAWIGHAQAGGFRERGSSGGLVSWVAAQLLESGAVDGVAHVVPDAAGGQLLRYRISRSSAALNAGAKSRYYPVELSEVLREIRALPGRYAVVGVPCFIKAVQLMRREEPVLAERIVATLGLVCGHMKSRQLTESYARQMDVRLAEVAAVDFRRKAPERPARWYVMHFGLAGGRSVERPWDQLAEGDWGAGFHQNPACSFCDDVLAETADIAFGDAWIAPHDQDCGGTNVVVARSPAMTQLLREGAARGELALSPVDAEVVRRTQAAGLRQRREGLACRLAWRHLSPRPRKRVAPGVPRQLGLRRRLLYRLRAAITWASRRGYRLARGARAAMALYLRLARVVGRLYHFVAYGPDRPGWRR